VPANVAATPTDSTSSAQALALLLLATCSRQRKEIERLAEERAALVAANSELAGERHELRRRNEELSRRLGLDSTTRLWPVMPAEHRRRYEAYGSRHTPRRAGWRWRTRCHVAHGQWSRRCRPGTPPGSRCDHRITG
jgi:hypothetical protein